MTIGIFICLFAVLAKEYLPPDIAMISGAGLLVVTGVIEPKHLLRGFSQPVLFVLAMLFITAKAVEQNGVLNSLSTHILKKGSSMTSQLTSMMLPLSFFSSFLNNTPIVLMLTPFVRKKALEIGMQPSKFLIPLSFATIFGGTCSLIGTSGNLIVDDMLQDMTRGQVGLGFFELAKVGVIFVGVGTAYMALIGHRLLPIRDDATSHVFKTAKEFVAEFKVENDCELLGSTVKKAGEKFFQGERLIEIVRGKRVIEAPDPEEYILTNDELVFAGDIDHIKKLHEIPGLTSLVSSSIHLSEHSTHFSEAIVSTTSSLIGKTLKQVNFRGNYGGTVLAVYRQGKRQRGKIGEIILLAGDLLIILTGSENWFKDNSYTNDFYFLRFSEKLPVYNGGKVALLVTGLLLMVLAVFLGIGMFEATFCMATLCLLSGSITIREARKAIRWNLLILIGSAFAMAYALDITGVAKLFAQNILPFFGSTPFTFIAGLFLVTLLITEFITNNAAVLLVFPIAIETMKLSGFVGASSLKAVAVTIALGASCSFLTPIGYQTNTIVYGPGGYKFSDYFKVGWPLSLTFLVLVAFLVPYYWPMHHV